MFGWTFGRDVREKFGWDVRQMFGWIFVQGVRQMFGRDVREKALQAAFGKGFGNTPGENERW